MNQRKYLDQEFSKGTWRHEKNLHFKLQFTFDTKLTKSKTAFFGLHLNFGTIL